MTGDRPCDLCGAASHAPLYEIDGFSIARCRSCGLVFVSSPPDPEQRIALYDESYYEHPDAIGYRGYRAAEDRKRHHDRGLIKQIEELRPRGDLLEIGCAYGYFLDEARRRGWRVRGVEPSAHAAEHARAELSLAVVAGAFTDLEVEPESTDAIALWDVLEHLPNPRRTIEAACAWLRPGGILALSTGDIGSLSARLHGADWSLMTPPWHQFYFSRATLRRMLEQAGLEVVRLGGDGSVAVDPDSARPRIRGSLCAILMHPAVTRAARRLGGGAIMFAFARKRSS